MVQCEELFVSKQKQQLKEEVIKKFEIWNLPAPKFLKSDILTRKSITIIHEERGIQLKK